MKRPRSYLFTSKKQSTRALISTILGLISIISSTMMIVLTYRNNGVALFRYGAVIFVCLFFSLAGLILGILSTRETDKWHFFSWVGIVLNALVLFLCFAAMYLGVVVE